jgi:AmmeMemoRadiSam system protein A
MPSNTFGVISPHPPIFVPAVGGSEAHSAQSSLDALEAAHAALERFAPETIVLMSPHAPAFYDAFLVDASARLEGSLGQFGDSEQHAWLGDPQLAEALLRAADDAGIPAVARSEDSRVRAGWLDHATIVPLSFLEPTGRVPLVVLSLSSLDYATHRRFGELIRQSAERLGRKVAFVASGDMSHRLTPGANAGYSPRAAELDATIVSLVREGAFEQLMHIDPGLIEAGGECGLRSVITLGGFAGPDPVPTLVLSYEGPWGVGYLTALVGDAAFAAHSEVATATSGMKGGSAGHDESDIVKLARSTIEHYVRTGTTDGVHALDDPEYPERAGAFVSLHRGGMLRGCIGTIAPTRKSLAEEVAANAIQAATEDPRFSPLSPGELADLDVKVDVLHPPESCTIADLDPKNFGVIVTHGYRRGLLLPDLEGVDDVAHQVAIAMQKAGIQPGTNCDIERFKVDRYT